MKKKRIVSVLLSTVLLSSSLTVPAFAFKDTENHWAKKYIDDLSSEEIVKGYDEDTFMPDKHISREEVAAIVDRALKSQNIELSGNKSEKVLSDVDGRWSTESVKKLISAGVITGYPDDTFKPEQHITRQELVKLVNGIINPDAKGDNVIDFNDIEGEWGKEFVKRLSQLGLINGYPDGSFKPNDNITRAEVSKIISELLNNSDNLLITEDDSEDEEPGENETPDDSETPGQGDSPGGGSSPGQGGSTGQNSAPVITASDRTIKTGDTLDLKAGVTAIDREDGDLTGKITVTGDVPASNGKANKTGTYQITYTVKDSKGKETVKKINITVVANNKDGLKTAINSAGKIDTSGKTPESVKKLNDAKTAAQAVVNNDDATAEEIEKALSDLIDAIAGLEDIPAEPENQSPVIIAADKTIKIGDTVDLKAGVTAEDVEDGDLTDKIEVTGTVPTAAGKASKAGTYPITYTVKDSDNKEVTKTVNVTVVPINKDGLKTAISSAGKIDSSGKTPESVKKLNDAKTAAQAVVDNDDATKKEIEKALSDLIDAIAGLEDIPAEPENQAPVIIAADKTIKIGDTVDLKAGVTAEDVEDGDLTDKIEVTGTVPTAAGKASKAGTYPITYTVKDSDNKEVTKTVNITVEPVDKSALDTLVNEAKKIDLSDKTKATADVFTAALENAENVLANENAMPNEVAEVFGELLSASLGLKENREPTINASDRSITVGDNVDSMSGVIAQDYEDGDITDKITATETIPRVEGTDRAKETGVYTIAYSVTDNDGKTSEKSIKVTVKSVDKAELIEEIEEAEKIDLDGYDQASVQLFSNALNKAKEVKDDVNALPENVAKAISDLKNAIDGLSEELSDSTEIKVKDGKDEIVKGIEHIDDYPMLSVYEAKPDGTFIAVQDIIDSIESQDGSTQTYTILDDSFEELDGTALIKDYELATLHIVAEDGIAEDYIPINISKLDQEAPKDLIATAPTTIDNNDGKISGVNSSMEYQKEGDTEFTSVGENTEITGLSSGTYYVRYAEKAGFNASPATEVEVGPYKSSSVDIEAKDNAEVVKDITESGSVKSVNAYKVKLDGTKTKYKDVIAEIKSADDSNQTYRVLGGWLGTTVVDLEDEITTQTKLEVTSENGEFKEAYTITPTNRAQEKPVGVEGVNVTETEKGKIKGVTDKMEYKSSASGSNWIDINDTVVDDLDAGTYEVRYKAIEGYDESERVFVTIEDYVAPVSSVTTIKAKPGATEIISIDSQPDKDGKIETYLFSAEGEHRRISDVISEIESTDGSEQSYEARDSLGTPISEHTRLTNMQYIYITSEDESKTVKYLVVGKNRDQGQPEGVEVVHETATKKGMLKGVSYNMQYKKSTDTTWISIFDTEVPGLSAGNYDVRYKAYYGYNEGPAKTYTIKKVVSSVTTIKTKDGAEVVSEVVDQAATGLIWAYYVKPNGEIATLGDIKAEIESTDGSNQTYSFQDMEDNELDLSQGVDDGLNLIVTAENGSSTKTYVIMGDDRDQSPPTGVEGVNATTTEKGKITGVDNTMEYKLSTANKWTEVAGEVVADLDPGTYQVRYAERYGFKASNPVSITIEEAAPTLPENVTLELNPDITGVVTGIDEEEAAPVVYYKSGTTAGQIKSALKVVEDSGAEMKVMDEQYNHALEKDDDDTLETNDELVVTRTDGKTKTYTLIEKVEETPDPGPVEESIPPMAIGANSGFDETRTLSFMSGQATADWINNISKITVLTPSGKVEGITPVKTSSELSFTYAGRDIAVIVEAEGYKNGVFFIDYVNDEVTNISEGMKNEERISSIDKGVNGKYTVNYSGFNPSQIKFAIVNETYLSISGSASSSGSYLTNGPSTTELFRIEDPSIEKIVLMNGNGTIEVKNY